MKFKIAFLVYRNIYKKTMSSNQALQQREKQCLWGTEAN